MSDSPKPDNDFPLSDRDDEYARLHDPERAEREAAAKKEAELAALDRKKLLTALLQDPRIREWFWELITEFDAFNTRFGDQSAGHAAGQVSFYWRGLHDAGWRLWTQLDDAAPELASLMRREHNPGSAL